MSDLSRMSDAELMAALGGGQSAPSGPVAQMSDADLMSALGAAPGRMGFATPAQREGPAMDKGTAHALGRGAAQGVTFGFYDELRGLNDAGGGKPNEPASLGNLLTGAYRRLTGSADNAAYNRSRNEARDDLTAARDSNPVAAYGGEIVGGLALPVGSMAGTTTRTAAALAGARAGMIGGGAYGAGNADEFSDVPAEMAKGGAIGGVLGGALGGAIGPAVRAAPKPNEIAAAGERLGVPVPKFVASESMPVQRLAAAERNIPFAGDKLVKSMDELKTGMTGAADDLASNLGGTSAREAGERAGAEIERYIGPTLRAVSQRNYDAVDKLIAPNAGALHPMSSAQSAVADILAKRFSAGIEKNGAAVDFIADSLRRGKGLTYDGLKELRTRFGGYVPDDVKTDTVGREFKTIYSALTDDIRNAVRSAGGPQALTAWEKANRIHAMGADRAEALQKIIGRTGDNAGENVFDRLLAMAGSTARADMSKLVQARKAMGPEAWKEFTGTAVQRLGRDMEGNWTPDRFVTAWGKMSDAGKAALFGTSGPHRQALDDIYTISSRIKDRYSKFGNPSGTAQNAIGGELLSKGPWAAVGTAGWLAPMTTAGLLLGNRVLSSVLASPATASSMAKWSRAYSALVAKPAAGTMAAFQQATKNFASTVGDKLGVNVNPIDFLRAMQSYAPVRADNENQGVERRQ